MTTSFGLLLPHFGSFTSRSYIVDGAQMAEELGFSSVWARDHLIYKPHGFEDADAAFLDAFSTLTFIAAKTQKLLLGTGAAIPTRHPLHLAQIASSLTHLAGSDRLILGLGAGGFTHEFDAIGVSTSNRRELVIEQITIMRAVWSGRSFSHEGQHYRFEDVSLKPVPDGAIPVLYAGGSPAAVRLAGSHFDGWLPGRINLPTLAKRLTTLRKLFEKRDNAPITGVIPITSIDLDPGSALAQVPLDNLLKNANGQRLWERPPGGQFSRPEHLAGSFIFGDPALVIDQVRELVSLGLDHLVFDLRFRFKDWERQIKLLGEHVLPEICETST